MMTKKRPWWLYALAALLAVAAFLIARRALGDEPIGIEIWRGEKPAMRAAFPTALVERELNDAQYLERIRFSGFDLAPVIEGNKGPDEDLVVLRFDNGVVIPLRLDQAVPAIFVATSMWDESRSSWTNPRPRHRTDRVFQDVRPIEFQGHKVVVEVKGDGFSPWRHTGSLVALEYTTRAAWTAPFDAGTSRPAARGEEIFVESCQFCHSVRGHGGALGWDFVEPLPVTEYRRTPNNLRLHVNHRVSNAMELGLLMPVPRTLTAEEAKALWSWIEALAKTE